MNLKRFFIVVFLMVVTVGMSQNSGKKLDKIIKRNYEIIECTISKMSDKEVDYSLPGETLVISLDVSQIARIEFASGRSQNFDTSSAATNSSTVTNTSAAAKVPIAANTIAVLPIPYVNSDNLQSSEEMSKMAQNDMYNKIIAQSANILPLKVQDLRTTNSLLHKAGINYINIDDTPIEDLQNILGVDNIIASKISFTITQTNVSTTYNSGTYSSNSDYTKAKDKSTSSTIGDTQVNYHYTVYLDMYKNGQKIFSQTRQPLLNFKDSWTDSFTYLLKRSPIYSKR